MCLYLVGAEHAVQNLLEILVNLLHQRGRKHFLLCKGGKIRQYCQEHFAEKISNREIAVAVYLTPDYANRVFKDAYGLSIKDYLTDLRMQKAQLLRDEANTISEVAAQVGFDNFSYFSTQFKKYTGLTPNEWKRQNG